MIVKNERQESISWQGNKRSRFKSYLPGRGKLGGGGLRGLRELERTLRLSETVFVIRSRSCKTCGMGFDIVMKIVGYWLASK